MFPFSFNVHPTLTSLVSPNFGSGFSFVCFRMLPHVRAHFNRLVDHFQVPYSTQQISRYGSYSSSNGTVFSNGVTHWVARELRHFMPKNLPIIPSHLNDNSARYKFLGQCAFLSIFFKKICILKKIYSSSCIHITTEKSDVSLLFLLR